MGVRLSVSVEPLLAERGQEGSEQCGTEGCIKYGLNLTDAGTWTCPTRRGDCLARRGDSSGHIEEELEDGVVQLFVVRREF